MNTNRWENLMTLLLAGAALIAMVWLSSMTDGTGVSKIVETQVVSIR